jgi:tetratricopeptide (TPR) repeat protein
MTDQREPDEQAQLDWEIEFFEGILRRDDGYGAAMRILAELYTRRGRHQDALNLDRRITRLYPNDAGGFYNLACSLALTEDINGAFSALEQAWALGYRDVGWLRRDPDLRSVRSDPRYEQFLRERTSETQSPHA